MLYSRPSRSTTIHWTDTDGDGIEDGNETYTTTQGNEPLGTDLSITGQGNVAGGVTVEEVEPQDSDGDELPNALETNGIPIGHTGYGSTHVETNPDAKHSDDDGLTDGEEVGTYREEPFSFTVNEQSRTQIAQYYILTSNPQLEDSDDDGLTNVEEYEAETSPKYADIDRDGLTDPQELANGTDPWQADTDDDGLDDGVEPTDPFNTDPLDPDTDDDGVLDGNETYTTTASNESVGVEVELTGQGNVAGAVTVGEQTERFAQGDRVANMSVSEIVEIEATEAFESANVTIEYDDSLPATSNESDLVVVTYDREKQLYVPLNSTIDAANNTVTAETEHFSTFAVFSISNWAADITAERSSNGTDSSEDGGIQPVDVQFIIDSSGSMSWNDPQEFRKQAAKEFVGALVDGDRAGVVDFDHTAHVDQELTTDFGAVNVTIEQLDAQGGTNIGAGVARANQHFVAASNDSRAKVAIVLTDGQGSGGRAQARTAADRNITIHTIGFGGADGNKLSDIASITGGSYHYVSDASELPNVFSRVAEEVEPKDSDGDGLPDVLEEEGLPIGHTGADVTRLQTNSSTKNTDDDDLTDGEEAGEYREYPISFSVDDTRHQYVAQYYELTSNPTLEDTDSDGVDDDREVNGWKIETITRMVDGEEVDYRWAGSVDQRYNGSLWVTSDPMEVDTDDDGLTDYAEKEYTHTDPEKPVTYGITREQADMIETIEADHAAYRFYFTAEDLGVPVELASADVPVGKHGLNDATSDFDFVTDDSVGEYASRNREVFDRLTFTALDGTQRTDTWLSNTDELSEGTRPWDPDTDDDGLTDGQELNGIRKATTGNTGGLVSFTKFKVTDANILEEPTEPLNPDTDGDGYWDGWIGVHDVGYSDNVILYREHLQTGDGVEGDEVVPEQAGTHVWNGDEHANLHVGELQWGTDPTDDSDREIPSPSLSVEVDFYEGVNTSIDSQTWENGIERNFALYGIDVNVIRDETFDAEDLWLVNPNNGFGLTEMEHMYEHQNYNTEDADVYSQVLTYCNSPLIPGGRTQSGFNHLTAPYIGIFTEGHQEAVNEVERNNQTELRRSPYENGMQMTSAKTMIHEIGHSLNIGAADDKFLDHPFRAGEVYSNSPSDPNPEYIRPENRNRPLWWSIMRSGWGNDLLKQPMSARYFVFSIQELSTIQAP